DGYVYCLDAADGSLSWKLRAGPKDERLLARGHMISRWPVRTGVVVADEIAYFGAGIFPHETVYLCAADAKTGKLLWKNDRISARDAGRDDLSPQGYLLANEDSLFVPSGRTLPAAFDRKTGEFKFKKSYSWRSSAGGVIGGSKAMLADGQLYSSAAHHFIALDEKSGAAGFAFPMGRQMSFQDEVAYIATGKELIAVDRPKHAAASVARQKLYVQRRSLRRDPKKLAELDRKMEELSRTGLLWSYPFEGDSSLILTGNLVLAGGQKELVAVHVKTGREAWKHAFDAEVRGLAAANGHLLVSTTAGKSHGFSDARHTPKKVQVANHPPAAVENPYPRDALSELYEKAAEQILARTKTTDGFCLVLGSEEGRLAFELAKRTKLRVYGVESDAEKVERSRRKLAQAGLHGRRVTIVHAQPDATPLSNYFANLVVSDSMLLTGKLPTASVELGRYVKPCGGVACFGVPTDSKKAADLDSIALKQDLAAMYLRDDAEIKTAGSWAVLTRGKLADVGDWSHQYGGVDNACFSPDERIKGSLGVLWYGDPGPQQMVNRHDAASAPLSTNGRFFTQGIESVRAFDAYNGKFLWEHKNPGAIRTGVFNNNETSNLAATDDSLFVVVNDTCTQLDAATGEVRRLRTEPQSEDYKTPTSWRNEPAHDGLLVGTSTIRSG
ncbi:MAG: PQQ-binding-like beta-propeller repeat protein, partial [Planctomycetales bacterium]